MDELSEEEKMEAAGRYAVAMHLEANAKVGGAAKLVLPIVIVVAILVRSFLPLVIGVALCIALYFYLIHSCVRFVRQQTGMPDQVQAYFSRRYKTDPKLAEEVDELRTAGTELARHLSTPKR